MLNGEAANTNFLVFDWTRPGLKPMIYHTRGEHTNHYTTDVAWNIFETIVKKLFFPLIQHMFGLNIRQLS